MGTITKKTCKSDEEWRELRRHYIGGSDAATVVGLNPFASRYSLWAQKTGAVKVFAGNLATEVGNYLEEFVAQKFEEESGKSVRRNNSSIFNSDYPWAIANVDRLIVGEDAGLEIKTTSELNMKRFTNGEYPSQYYVQCMHYMAVTEKPKWYLAVLIGNRDFRTFVIERNEEEIKALMKAEEYFYYNHLVSENNPPEADGSNRTTETVECLFPSSDGTECDLSAVSSQIRLYTDLSKQIAELTEMRDEAANRIKSYMGSSERGETSGFKVSWKSSCRRTFDTKAFIGENPDFDIEKYYKITGTRCFRVSEAKNE